MIMKSSFRNINRMTKKKIALNFLLILNTFLIFGQSDVNVVQGEYKSQTEELKDFKTNICDGYYFLLTRSNNDEYITPFKGNKFKFNKDGTLRAKIDGVRKKGTWRVLLWYDENKCDLKIEFPDSSYCFNISVTSGWKKETNRFSPWRFHVTTESKKYVFVSKFNYAKRGRKNTWKKPSFKIKRKYKIRL